MKLTTILIGFLIALVFLLSTAALAQKIEYKDPKCSEECLKGLKISESELSRLMSIIRVEHRTIDVIWLDDPQDDAAYVQFILYRINLNSHYLKYFKQDELIAIIFHELAHLIYYRHDPPYEYPQFEYDPDLVQLEELIADYNAVHLLIKYGYNPAGMIHTLERTIQIFETTDYLIDPSTIDLHRSIIETRIRNLRNNFPELTTTDQPIGFLLTMQTN